MNAVVLLLAVLPCISALVCFKNHTHMEECTGMTLGFPHLCYNRTVNNYGHHAHHFGCASLFQRMIPRGCIVIDKTTPWLEKGKVCLCDVDGCNKHIHRSRARYNSSTAITQSISLLIAFLIFHAL